MNVLYCKKCGKKLPENAKFCPGCGTTIVTDTEGQSPQNDHLLPMGTMLHGLYRIEQYLASGGFGNTYRVTDVSQQKSYAVKEFFNSTINSRDPQTMLVAAYNSTNTADFTAQLNKFRKEARRIRGIDSEHIVKVHDIFDENGTAYYVMDFIDGESLQAKLKREGTLPEDEVMGYLNQMLDALDEIHSRSIWHLDLKPGNMMLDKDGKLMLIDFGASKLIDTDRGAMTSSLAMAYTPGFAPIEQTEQKIHAIGAPTDLYAIGATLYNLLTGTPPPNLTELLSQGSSAFHFPASTSPTMRQLVMKLMQVRGEHRPQNVAQVRNLIAGNEVETDETISASPQPLVSRTEEDYEDEDNSSRKKWIMAAIGALIAIAAIGGWAYWNNSRQQAAALAEQARQDSIATAQALIEQAYQDSLAAEQARQDSIAKWDFFTADEIEDISFTSTTAISLRNICKRHGMSILYENEYDDNTYADQTDRCLELVAGKGCELASSNRNGYRHRSLKATSDVAFGIELTGTDYSSDDGIFSLDVQGYSMVSFAFPTKEARDRMIKELKASKCERYEENGLYWLRLFYPV